MMLLISSSQIVFAATTKHYTASNREICLSTDFVSCTITINGNLDLTYTDSTSMRTFSDHKWSTIFTSPNSREVTDTFNYSMGNLIHKYGTGGQTVCYNNGPGVPVYSDPSYIKHINYHSITKVSHARRSNGSAQFAYTISGDAFISKSHTFVFSGIAK